MRRWLLLVMILLLPVRGIVGDAMAGQMLQQRAQHAVAVMPAAAADAGHHVAAAAHDCAGHAQQTSPAADHEGAPADCPTCASCQVCSSVALSMVVRMPPAVAFTQLQPRTAEPVDASAEPSLAFKPPRS